MDSMLYTGFLTCVLLAAARACTDTEVSNISPRYGGLGGGVRITIWGCKFSADKYGKGNEAWLVDENNKLFNCSAHVDGSTEAMITCDTAKGMVHDAKYSVKIRVDGKDVPASKMCPGDSSRCTFIPHNWLTPSIEELPNGQSFSAANQDNILKSTGRLISDRLLSTEAESSNGVQTSFVRAYLDNNVCLMFDGDGQKFGIALFSEDSRDGYVMCNLTGTFVGFTVFTFLLGAPNGRSVADGSLEHISPGGKVYTILRYSEMKSLSPQAGSTLGGTLLTIDGWFFEDSGPRSTYAKFNISVGGEPCTDVTVIKDSYATCKTPLPSTAKSEYPGGLGFYIQWWDSGSFENNAAIRDTTTTPTGTRWLYQTKFCSDSDLSESYSRMSMFFRAPHTGSYSFHVKATNGAELYIDGVSYARSNGGWGTGSRINFVKDYNYKIVIVTKSGSNSEACSEAMYRFYGTKMLSLQSYKVKSETQIVRLTSDVKQEEQMLDFSDFGTSTATQEVQKVCSSGATKGRLCLGGVCTLAPVELSVAGGVKEALDALPGLDGDTFGVTISDNCLIITIKSSKGKFPLFTTNTPGLTLRSSRTTVGVPDNSKFSFAVGNVTSSSLTHNEADKTAFAASIKEKLMEVYSVRCPAVLNPTEGTTQTFESDMGDSDDGERVTDVIPFCGRYACKNCNEVLELLETSKVTLTINKWFCLAFKGLESVTIKTDYISPSKTERKNRRFTISGIKTFTYEGDWTYGCINLLTAVKGENSGESSDRYALEKLVIDHDQDDGDFYIDNIFFGKSAPFDLTATANLHQVRLGPGSLSSASETVLVKSVSVEYDTEVSKYKVGLEPHDCGSHFNLLTLAHSEVTTGAYPSTTATSKLDGTDGQMVTAVTQKATPALSGSVSINVLGVASDPFSVTDTDENIRKVLQSSSTKYGSVKVTTDTTTASICANKDLKLEFLSHAGDFELGTIEDASALEPTGATASMVADTDGYEEDSPMMGVNLNTVKTKRQVQAWLNNVLLKCKEGVDCSFDYSNAETPEITSLDITEGSYSGTLKITGSLLSDTAEVTIGGADCEVTAATASLITCTLGNAPSGEHEVKVYIPEKGYASGDLKFTYTSDMTGSTPTEGSLGGGNIMTVAGSGLSPTAQVYVGDLLCATIATPEPDEIKCQVPTFHTLPTTESEITETVRVKTGDTYLSSTGLYTYKKSLTAIISNIAGPASLSVSGGETLTITATNLLTSPTVSLGGEDFTDTNLVDSSTLEVVTPVLPPGSGQTLEIDNGHGFALMNDAVPEKDVALVMNNVTPLKGSLLGGTSVTVTGLGFGTKTEDVKVKFLDYDANVVSVANDKVVFTTGWVGGTYYVGNTGEDYYYSYNVTSANYYVGDTIVWEWTTPSFIEGVKNKVLQVKSLTSTEAVPGGIDSGTSTRNGQFSYTFTAEGTYHFNNGPDNTRTYWMSVRIANRPSFTAPLSLTVKEKDAGHNVGGASDPTNTGCSKLEADITDVTAPSLTPEDSTKFNFMFLNTRTPVVTEFSFQNASAEPRSVVPSSALTIKGKGFSASETCTNKVTIGPCDCQVTVDSSTQFTCTLDNSCDFPNAEFLHLGVNINGYGNAQLAIASMMGQHAAFLHEITGMEPASGSTEGGTAVTLSGSGLAGATAASIDDVEAVIMDNSNGLVIKTGASDVAGSVKVFIGNFESKCSSTTNTKCEYKYLASKTPTITSITPSDVQAETLLTIGGTKFSTVKADMSVSIAGHSCDIEGTPIATSLTCRVLALPVGDHQSVELWVKGLGNASTTQTVKGLGITTAVNPNSGSLNGGTKVTITGHGFNGETTVTYDGKSCSDVAVTLTRLTCITEAHAAGEVQLAVTSNNVLYSDTLAFTFSTASTPTITNLEPSTVAKGDTLAITGEHFGSDVDKVSVKLGDYDCGDVVLASDTRVECTVGTQVSGAYAVSVGVVGKGLTNTLTATYKIKATGVNPSTGSKKGSQLVTVAGAGFNENVTATVCGKAAAVESFTESALVLATPAGDVGDCEVKVREAQSEAILVGTYTYEDTLVPEIASIDPTTGGTAGGTKLTIAGTNLNGALRAVSIGGSACAVDSGESTATQIVCTTSSHEGTVIAPVELTVDGLRAVNADDFYYVDRWGSTNTWGGEPVPSEGEIVSIPKGQDVLLDESTPVLKMLVIEGKLMFDDSKALIELNAEIIMVINGGVLEVGTEKRPYKATSRAVITMHGHPLNPELPIYGNKVLALREGRIDMHGSHIPVPWTTLAATASAGASTITLDAPVDGWEKGNEIVIATTGDSHSQKETEELVIEAVSSDKRTLTLTKPLEYTHIAEVYSCTTPEKYTMTRGLKAEVGLLTRNVLFQGKSNQQWNDKIEACPDGFDPGEFATQTCFQGRFGEETGSDEFGAHILVHGKEKNEVKGVEKTILKMTDVELHYVGQAFRLGRYPIHFHLNKELSLSYVNGSAIHKTFNRAINIHGTNSVTVTRNVIYDVRGGALFLEDGIEQENVFQYNLLLFVGTSTSLLKDDITPAGFWMRNPKNYLRHNHCAGGTHFCYWYAIEEHPMGPSYDPNICPQKMPLGAFSNNSAHSQGWFGLWVFVGYFPTEEGTCDGITPKMATFLDLTSWNNEKGIEFVNAGALQLENLVAVNNTIAGFEWKLAMNPECSQPNLHHVCIAGALPGSSSVTTQVAVKLPYGFCFEMEDILFDCYLEYALQFTEIQGTCIEFCGGYISYYSKIGFSDTCPSGSSDKIMEFRWSHEGLLHDKDGSLCNTGSGAIYAPHTGTHIPTSKLTSSCNRKINVTVESKSYQSVSPTVDFVRLAFGEMMPSNLEAKEAKFENSEGYTLATYRAKRLTIPNGWMVNLIDGDTYKMTFVNAEGTTNISYTAEFDYLKTGLIIGHDVDEEPDQVSIDGGTSWSSKINAFDVSSNGLKTGDWYFENNVVFVAFIPLGSSNRKKRGGTRIGGDANRVNADVVLRKCFYADCIPPPDPEVTVPATVRPSYWKSWKDSTWGMEDGAYTPQLDGTAGLPPADADVTISNAVQAYSWIVLKEHVPENINILKLTGTLEIDYEDYNYVLKVKYMVIFGGGFIAGWVDNRMKGTFLLQLLGSMDTPLYLGLDSYSVGNKAVAALGRMDLHGPLSGSSWAKLAQTASSGSRQLTLDPSADLSGWKTGDKVAIPTTTRNAAETEWRAITSVDTSGNTVTVDSALTYTHMAHTESVNGEDVYFGGAVQHMTRGLVVEGEAQSGEHWGGRILVTTGQMKGSTDLRSGFLRASETEFRNMGHDGYTAPWDHRSAVNFNSAPASEYKPSSLENCAFWGLSNGAISLYGSDNIDIKNNVVYEPVGDGIHDESGSTVYEGNMVTNTLWTGSVFGRNEPENIRFQAAFWLVGSTDVTFKNNWAIGSQRVGVRLSGECCTQETSQFSGNYAFGNIMGLCTFHEDIITACDCVRWSGFTVFNNNDYGIYYNNEKEFQLENVIVGQEVTGVFIFIFGPSSLSHQLSSKKATVKNSKFIGAFSNHDCSAYTTPSGLYISETDDCRGHRSKQKARLMFLFPIFSQGPNNSPLKPCGNIMAYMALMGKTIFEDNYFKNIGQHSTCGTSYAISDVPSNEDANHAVYTKGTTTESFDTDFAVLFTRSSASSVNPSDCGTMTCDAKKMQVLYDEDGSLMGSPTTFISEAEYNWDGETSFGIGDYRIPKTLLTDLEGNRKHVADVARNGRGNIRSSGCTKKSVDASGLYVCPYERYETLVVEMLDDDNEDRILSPVAIVTGGYIGLLNGPQDHGWCSGYACLKRLQTFFTLVKPGYEVKVYLTSTEPESMRFFMIYAESSSCVVIAYFVSNPNRFDTYIKDGTQYVDPKNAETVNGRLTYKQETGVDYIPTCNDPVGTNYVDKQTKLVYVVLKGDELIRVVRAKVLVVSLFLPAMSVDDFYSGNIIENFAYLLGVPLSKVRVTSVIAASRRRRRRSTEGGIAATIEVGDNPAASADEEEAPPPPVESSEDTDAVSSESATPLAEAAMAACQLSDMNDALGADASCTSVTDESATYEVAVPSELRFEQTVVAQHEGVPLATQPKLRAYDTNGIAVPNLGINGTSAWQITATLRNGTGHASAALSGTTTITSVSGWMNFTDLTISHAGSGYIIDFEVTGPSAAAAKNFSIESAAFDIAGLPLTGGLYSMTTGNIIKDDAFSLSLDLRDSTTNERITNITWRNHAFTTTCGLVVETSTGSLGGSLTNTFDDTTGTAVFNDLTFSGDGFITVACQIVSTPPEYDVTFYQDIIVMTPIQANITTEATSIIVLKYDLDYLSTLPTTAAEKQLLMATVQRVLQDSPYTRIVSAALSQGSILVTLTVEGSTIDTTAMLNQLCSNLSSGIDVTVGLVTLTLDGYMTVDGVNYYGTCAQSNDDDDDGLHPAFIALIAVCCLLVIVAIIVALLWVFKIRPKTKTHDNGRTVYLGGANQRVEDIFYNKPKGAKDMRASTEAPAPVTTLYDDLDVANTTTRTSPLPVTPEGLYKESTMTQPGY